MKPVVNTFVKNIWLGDRELIMYRQKGRYVVFDSYNDYSLIFAGDYGEFARMGKDEIKELIQTELEESGYMYTLGMLHGMYKAGAFNAAEWCTLSMYLADLNMDRIG